MPHLPAEVWLQVVSHLRRPLPRPDGRALSRDIRQGDLTAMMRVNKGFYSMIAPILYDTVITDDLSLLLVGSDDKRRINNLPSKLDLILNIKELHLEYRAADSSNADRSSVFYSPDCWRDTKSDQATSEAQRTELSLISLTEIVRQGKARTRLRTISSGSFLGGRDAHWEMCEIQGGRQAISASKCALLELLKTVNCKGFCQRGVYGPLALPYECPGLLDLGFDICVHVDQAIFRAPIATTFSSIDPDAPPVQEARDWNMGDVHGTDHQPYGHSSPNTIWYVEADRFSDSIAAREMGRESGEPMMLLGMYANYYNHNRLVGLNQGEGEGDVARLKGYISQPVAVRGGSDIGSSQKEKDKYIKQIREHVNLRLLKTLGYSPRGYKWADVERDEVGWEMMDKAPACRGCGWAPEVALYE